MPRESVLPWLPLANLPAWNQQVVALSDGSLATGRYNECGETCVGEVIAGVWGVPVNPDALRAAAGGPYRGPLTTAADLVAMLHFGNVQAQAYSGGKDDSWAQMEACLADQRPVIMLGLWPTPGGAEHWLLATAIADGKVYYNNPWNGARSWITQQDFGRYYDGSLVLVSAHLHYPASLMVQPW